MWTTSNKAGSGIPPVPEQRSGFGKAPFFRGEFYIIAGEMNDGEDHAYLADKNNVYHEVQIYNPVCNTWRKGPDIPVGTHGFFPVIYNDAIHIVTGGLERALSFGNEYQVYGPM